MTSFKINAGNAKRLDSSFRRIESNMNGMIDNINRINGSLSISDSSSAVIRQALNRSTGKIKNCSNAVSKYGQTLMEIVQRYEETDRRIAGMSSGDDSDTTIGKFGNDQIDINVTDDILKLFRYLSFPDFMGLVSILGPVVLFNPRISDTIRKLIDEAFETIQKNSEFINRIEDQSTKEALASYPDYARVIRESYDKSSGKARELFDKYYPGMKIATMDNSSSAYNHDIDSFKLDHNQINDPRGANKIFYHEYGHYIVDQQGWVYTDENGVRRESESFQKFHNSLDREVDAYIKSVEDSVRSEYTQKYGSRLSQSQLDRRIHDETSRRISEEVGSPNNRVNAIQDIISGATDDRYSIGYHHSSSYWQADRTRQGNEGFAQFYTIDFNQSSMEMEFIRKHLPETYKIYQDLLDEALSN